MMKDIFRNNLEALKARYESVYNYMAQLQKDDQLQCENVYIDESANGEKIVAVRRDKERPVYLNSRYNDDEFTNHWLEQFEDNKFKTTYIIFGTSNFRHVDKLLKLTGDSNPILIYEPDQDILIKVMSEIDITHILLSERIILCIRDINNEYLDAFLNHAVSYQNQHLAKYCCMPNYNELYPKEWKAVLEKIKYSMLETVAILNTFLLYSEEIIANTLAAVNDFVNQYSVNQLQNAFGDKYKDVPAIIVAAGPSLDKNIKDLKQAENKAFIVAVDTALKSLLNHDIVPDIILTVDSHKPPVLFMHTKFKNIPLVVCSWSNKELLPLYTGKRFYFDTQQSYLSGLFYEYTGQAMVHLDNGGSVANLAFSLAQLLQFEKLILIGQDLAYPNNVAHAQAAYGTADALSQGRQYFEVEDIEGNMVLTEANMDLYRRWFEEQIEMYPNLQVTDATEGGAKIKGTKIMTLKEAIRQNCNREVDIKALIKAIPPQFEDKEQEEILYRITHISDELEAAEKKINKGLRDYDKMTELSRKNKRHTKEFKDIIKRMGELSEFIDSSPELNLVNWYNQETEWSVLGTIYNTKDNPQEEIKDIIQNGTRMLKSYVTGIHQLKEDVRKKSDITKEQMNQYANQASKHINNILQDVKEAQIDHIDQYMKEFYNDFLIYVNALKTMEIKDSYNSLLSKLDVVVEKHEHNDYSGLVDILSKINGEIIKQES